MLYGYATMPVGTAATAACNQTPIYVQAQQLQYTQQPQQQHQSFHHTAYATAAAAPQLNCSQQVNQMPPPPPAPPIAPMPTSVDLPVDSACYRPPPKPCPQTRHYRVNEPMIVRSTDQHFTTCNTSVQENNIHIQHNRTVVTNVNRNHHHLHRIIVRDNNYHHFLTKNIIRAHDIHHQRIERIKAEGKTIKDHKETITVEPVASCSKGSMQSLCPEQQVASIKPSSPLPVAASQNQCPDNDDLTTVIHHRQTILQHPQIVQENIIQHGEQYNVNSNNNAYHNQPCAEELLIEEFDDDDDTTEPPEPASLIPPPPPQPPAPANPPPIIPERYLSDSEDDLPSRYGLTQTPTLQYQQQQHPRVVQQHQQQPTSYNISVKPQSIFQQARYDYQQQTLCPQQQQQQNSVTPGPNYYSYPSYQQPQHHMHNIPTIIQGQVHMAQDSNGYYGYNAIS